MTAGTRHAEFFTLAGKNIRSEKGVTGKRLMALTKPEIVSELGVSNLQV